MGCTYPIIHFFTYEVGPRKSLVICLYCGPLSQILELNVAQSLPT